MRTNNIDFTDVLFEDDVRTDIVVETNERVRTEE